MHHDNSHADPAAVDTAASNWRHFTQLMKVCGIAAAAVVLVLLTVYVLRH
jgi:hypothetical protein